MMNIKKIGHCCLLIRIDGATILTDPGMFSTAQNSLTGIDAVIITHEHADHLHVESVQAVMKQNPGAKIITNTGVGKHLEGVKLPYEIVEGRGRTEVKGVPIEAFDCRHEEIYEEYGQVQNTAYFIGGKFLMPGDSFFAPGVPVEILALPVAGPWCRLADAIRYGLKVNPKKAFPDHEAMISKDFRGFMHGIAKQVLAEKNIAFTPMNEGDEASF